METIQNYQGNLKQNEIFNISQFVVSENFKHHLKKELSANYVTDIDLAYLEDMNYSKNSQIFIVKNKEGEIIGSIRALKWNYINELPIQKMFGINPLAYINGNSINEIWHIGRFAIKKGVRSIRLLKKMLVYAIGPICEHKDNIAFAECDAKLLRIMAIMGIKAKIIGKSIDYLGSETVPVCMSYNGLIDFYNKNKYIIKEEDF